MPDPKNALLSALAEMLRGGGLSEGDAGAEASIQGGRPDIMNLFIPQGSPDAFESGLQRGIAGAEDGPSGIPGGSPDAFEAQLQRGTAGAGPNLSDSAGEVPTPGSDFGIGGGAGSMLGGQFGGDGRGNAVQMAKNRLSALNMDRFLGNVAGYHQGVRALGEQLAKQGFDPYDILGEASGGTFSRKTEATPMTNRNLYTGGR